MLDYLSRINDELHMDYQTFEKSLKAELKYEKPY